MPRVILKLKLEANRSGVCFEVLKSDFPYVNVSLGGVLYIVRVRLEKACC